MAKSLDITELMNQESKRISQEIMQAVNEGFVIWHMWDGPIEKGDQVRCFGMVTFWKPHGGERKKTWPENMEK